MRRLLRLGLGLLLTAGTWLAGCGDYGHAGRPAPPSVNLNSPPPLPAHEPPAVVPGTAALTGLPAPRAALAKLRAPRAVSWAPGEYLIYGGYFEGALGSSGVTSLGWGGQFTSTWQTAPSPSFDDLAYAFYAVNVPDVAGVTALTTDWTGAPTAGTGCFIGVGDFVRDTWIWAALPQAGEVPLDRLADCLDAGALLVVVCVLEEGPFTLNWLRAGPNLAPEAALDSDVSWGPTPLTVEFSLGDSFDPELTPLFYEWDWDSDGVYDASGPQNSAQHEFTGYGRQTVTGRVSDAGGASSTATLDVWPSRFQVATLAPQGYSPALVLDGAGEPVVSFSGGANHDELKLARHGPGGWSTTALDTVAGELDVETAIDVMATGDFGLAYGGGKLHYGVYTFPLYASMVVADQKGRGQPALALDDDDAPNILYAGVYGVFPLTTENLTHAYLDGGWQFSQISDAGIDGPWVDAEYRGYLVGAYLHRAISGAVGELRYGYFSTVFGWSWETLSTRLARGNDGVQVAVAGDHMPHLAFTTEPVDSTPSELKYTHYAGSAWAEQTADTGVSQFALALDQADVPHLMYVKHRLIPAGDDVWYAVLEGGEWRTEYAWESALSGLADLDLAIDAAGTPHLVFADTPDNAANTKVYYATFME